MATDMSSFLVGCFLLLMVVVVSADNSKRDKESSGVTFYGEAADKIINLLSDSCKCQKEKKEKPIEDEKEKKDKPIEDEKEKANTTNNDCSVSRPKDCSDLNKSCKSGIYKVFPDKTSGFDVYCHLDQHGKGWTVFQRRMNGKIDFYRDWQSYKKGFGHLKEEFWLGNTHLHQITSQGTYKLRVNMEDFENNKKYAEYKTFSVGNESSGYKLAIGTYSGDAGDSLSTHNGMKFSTKDKDNDTNGKSCATLYKGAWWHHSCHHSNLNGLYLKGKHKSFANGVNWHRFKGYNYSLKETVMMIQRV